MICTDCGKECEGQWVDFGIGNYEFWGMNGIDVQMGYVSSCCEADMVDSSGNKVEPPDEEGDRGDWEYDRQREKELGI